MPPDPEWSYATPDTSVYDLLTEVCPNDGVKRDFGPVKDPLNDAAVILAQEAKLARGA